MAQRRDQDDVRVPGIHEYLADVARVLEAESLPRRAVIAGLVDARAEGDVRADRGLAGAGVDDPRIGGGNGQRPDGGDRLGVEQRVPGDSGVGGAPHAAVHGAEVEARGVARDARDGEDATAAVRPDEAPAERRICALRNVLRGARCLSRDRARQAGEQCAGGRKQAVAHGGQRRCAGWSPSAPFSHRTSGSSRAKSASSRAGNRALVAWVSPSRRPAVYDWYLSQRAAGWLSGNPRGMRFSVASSSRSPYRRMKLESRTIRSNPLRSCAIASRRRLRIARGGIQIPAPTNEPRGAMCT